MKYNFIAIEREFGSGGTKIAQKAAQDCGIPCYGKEILIKVAEKYNVPAEKIQKYEESATNSLVYSMYMMSKAHLGGSDMLAKESQVYVVEQEVIREFASEGRAIFIGHCASEALSNRRGVARVFIRADKESKEKRIVEEYKIPLNEAVLLAKRFDKKRANYYYANTMQKWDDLRNYDMVLDSSRLGIDGCAAAIKGLLMND